MDVRSSEAEWDRVMRLRDHPIVEVTRKLSCSPEAAWRLVAVGARFRGYNADPEIGEWYTEPEITEVEDGRRWVWRVGPADDPLATWGFEVEPAEEGALVRQWARAGTGTSPLSEYIAQHPEQEAQIIDFRLGLWRDYMEANLALLAREVG